MGCPWRYCSRLSIKSSSAATAALAAFVLILIASLLLLVRHLLLLAWHLLLVFFLLHWSRTDSFGLGRGCRMCMASNVGSMCLRQVSKRCFACLEICTDLSISSIQGPLPSWMQCQKKGRSRNQPVLVPSMSHIHGKASILGGICTMFTPLADQGPIACFLVPCAECAVISLCRCCGADGQKPLPRCCRSGKRRASY